MSTGIHNVAIGYPAGGFMNDPETQPDPPPRPKKKVEIKPLEEKDAGKRYIDV